MSTNAPAWWNWDLEMTVENIKDELAIHGVSDSFPAAVSRLGANVLLQYLRPWAAAEGVSLKYQARPASLRLRRTR